MKLLTLSTLMLSLLLMASCKNVDSDAGEVTPEESETSGIPVDTTSEDVQLKDAESAEIDGISINMIVNDYLIIKDALVQSDMASTMKAAAQLNHRVSPSSNETFAEIQQSSKALEKAESMEEQRRIFEELSTDIYNLAKDLDAGQDLYWQHCPMAMDGKGANWLSAEEEIRNPYYGDKMLKCGKVQEKI